MMWDRVVRWLVETLEADPALSTALGGPHVYAAQAARPVRIPSVEWIVIGDRYEEAFNPIDIQLDYWARGTAQAVVIERRIRLLMHRETRRRVDAMDFSALYTDSQTHEYPQAGVVHRSLRFRFEPVRQRYATA